MSSTNRRSRSTIVEARQRRYYEYLVATCPPAPRPTKTERGPFETERAWQRQFRLQHGRCDTCGKLATPRGRRLRADRIGKLRCLKCWWGVGNIEVGSRDF